MRQRDAWEDLAGELEAAAAFARRQGAAIEQRFYEWQRIGGIPKAPAPCAACDGHGTGCDVCRGSGNAPAVKSGDGEADREASKQYDRFRSLVADLAALVQRFRGFESVAFPAQHKLEPRHLTAAQVEADDWCGSHWRIGEFVAIARRDGGKGEPYYRGRCRDCGKWPGGDPPIEVLKQWRDGRTLRVAAS